MKMDNPHMAEESERQEIDMVLELTSELVSAYVGNNTVPISELPSLINEVYSALAKASENQNKKSVTTSKPAVPINKSMTDDYIICLEDGKKFKSLKRHLRSHYDISPEEYREKWGLPVDYPMVAPNYAKARSTLARKMGLGRKLGTKIRK